MQHVCARPNSFVVSVCVPTCAQAVVVIMFTAQTFLGETGTPCRRFIVTSLLISVSIRTCGSCGTHAPFPVSLQPAAADTCCNLCQSSILTNIFLVVFAPVLLCVFDGR